MLFRSQLFDDPFEITYELYANDDIVIEAEHTSSKKKYSVRKNADEIRELTKKSKMELDSKQFYGIITTAFEKATLNGEYFYTFVTKETHIELGIIWKVSQGIKRDFELILNDMKLSDVDRMARMMSEFMAKDKGIVNITIITDKVRRIFNSKEPVICLKINKKYPDTLLHVTANISTLHFDNLIFGQFWSFGETKSYGCTFNQVDNLQCECVIENHKETGEQELKLMFNGHNEFNEGIINPNEVDFEILGGQTCSIIRVEEIR